MKISLLIIFVYFNFAHSRNLRSAGKIFLGTPALPNDAPHQVSLQAKSNLKGTLDHFCGGSLIARNKVVTAAHCAEGKTPDTIVVALGGLLLDALEQHINVVRIDIHPNWNREIVDFDFAVLTLATPAQLNSKVKTIGLGSTLPATNNQVVTTGWGVLVGPSPIPSVNLNKANLKYQPYSVCNATFPITDRTICASSVTSSVCFGDSGGPLTYNGLLIGITSFVLNELCVSLDIFPSYFASVPVGLSWINQQLQN